MIDKSMWGPGKWTEEPDEEQFEYRGYQCQLLRHPIIGVWRGYVVISTDHEIIKEDYSDIQIDVHGGITFGQYATDKVYILGFDCGHGGDIMPGSRIHTTDPFITNILNSHPSWITYKDIDFARNECKNIVNQLIKEAIT